MATALMEDAARAGISVVRPRRSAPGHRARRRPGAGPELAGLGHRLRRQPYIDARRVGRARLRHRRDRGVPTSWRRSRCGSASRRRMRITVDGRARRRASRAKDVILAIIGKIGAAGATGHVIEYAGSTIAGLSMEGRLTVCNMSIEAGARAGMIAPDDTTFAYLAGRPFAPAGQEWEPRWRAGAPCRPTPTPASTGKSRSDAGEIEPMVTWGTSPEDAVPITGRVPDPAAVRRAPSGAMRCSGRLPTWDSTPGHALTEVRIDRVFIGSCTNGRIEDLRSAAAVVARQKGRLPASRPGSSPVRAGEGAGGSRGARPHLPSRRLPVAPCRLLDVPRHQRRHRSHPASAAPRPPIAISSAARGRRRARI